MSVSFFDYGKGMIKRLILEAHPTWPWDLCPVTYRLKDQNVPHLPRNTIAAWIGAATYPTEEYRRVKPFERSLEGRNEIDTSPC
jgi:hypothetical protein